MQPIWGQQTTNTFNTEGWWKPASPPFSPEIKEDNRVTFRLKGPEAESVVLQLGEWDVELLPMQKDEAGIWQVTTDPISPGIYQYTFLVNGIPMPDMANPMIKAGTSLYGSMLEIRGEEPLFDQPQAVPHGDIHIVEYTSTSLQRSRTMYIYVPAEYHSKPTESYPVLYLRHGGGDNESSWIKDGRAGVILDNLIAGGKAVPMFIVMTNGLTDGSWSGGSTVEGMRALEEELLMDVIPLVEKRYRIKKREKQPGHCRSFNGWRTSLCNRDEKYRYF